MQLRHFRGPLETVSMPLTMPAGSTSPLKLLVSDGATLAGLEPLDVQQAERDLWVILQWLIAGAGEPWSIEALDTTGRIYRISALEP